MVQQVLGKRPVRVQLLYLSKPEAIIATPSEQSVTGVMRKTEALWDAIGRACERDDFRPHPGPLCNWCALPGVLPRVRRRPAPGGRAARPRAHDRAAAAAGHDVRPSAPHRSHRPSTPAVETAPGVDRAVALDRRTSTRPVMYTLSSAADHSLLWFIIGTGAVGAAAATSGSRRGSPPRWGSSRRSPTARSSRCSGASRPEHERRRGPAPVRHAPADHVVVPVGPRDRGVHRRGPARRPASRRPLVRARHRRRRQPRLRAHAPRLRRRRRRRPSASRSVTPSRAGSAPPDAEHRRPGAGGEHRPPARTG